MTMSKMVIYQIRNTKNGKQYIGSTIDKERRWRHHKYYLRNNKHVNQYLQNAFNKYGKDNFEFSVVEEIFDKDYLVEREQHYIDTLNPEYNIKPKADRSEHSEETKQKMREAHLGKNNPMYGRTGEDCPMYGKHHTEETKRKMSDNHVDFNGKNHPLYGRHRSEEVKQKISDNQADASGKNNPNSKLTKEEGEAIKSAYDKQDNLTLRTLADEYNVSDVTISNIVNGEHWTTK